MRIDDESQMETLLTLNQLNSAISTCWGIGVFSFITTQGNYALRSDTLYPFFIFNVFISSLRRGEITEQIYNFINGEFVPPEDGKYADTLNPSTGEALCKYPLSTAVDLGKAVEAANSAYHLWSKKCRVNITDCKP